MPKYDSLDTRFNTVRAESRRILKDLKDDSMRKQLQKIVTSLDTDYLEEKLSVGQLRMQINEVSVKAASFKQLDQSSSKLPLSVDNLQRPEKIVSKYLNLDQLWKRFLKEANYKSNEYTQAKISRLQAELWEDMQKETLSFGQMQMKLNNAVGTVLNMKRTPDDPYRDLKYLAEEVIEQVEKALLKTTGEDEEAVKEILNEVTFHLGKKQLTRSRMRKLLLDSRYDLEKISKDPVSLEKPRVIKASSVNQPFELSEKSKRLEIVNPKQPPKTLRASKKPYDPYKRFDKKTSSDALIPFGKEAIPFDPNNPFHQQLGYLDRQNAKRHKGKNLGQVFLEDPGYVVWLNEYIREFGSSQFKKPGRKRNFEKFIKHFDKFTSRSEVQALLEHYSDNQDSLSGPDLHKGRDDSDPKSLLGGVRRNERDISSFAPSDSPGMADLSNPESKRRYERRFRFYRNSLERRVKEYNYADTQAWMEQDHVVPLVKAFQRRVRASQKSLLRELAPDVPAWELQAVADRKTKQFVFKAKRVNKHAQLRSILREVMEEELVGASEAKAEFARMKMQAETLEQYKHIIFDRELALDFAMNADRGRTNAENKMRFVDPEKVQQETNWQQRLLATTTHEHKDQVLEEFNKVIPRKALELAGMDEQWDALVADHNKTLQLNQSNYPFKP